MQIDLNRLTSLVDEAKNNSKKRNFTQAMELVINFKGLDVKAPENRINEIVTLPNPIGKDVKVCVIADGDMVVKARQAGANLVITKQELDQYAGNKKAIKKLAGEYDYFAARIDLMATVGKTLGSVLGPRGKMPDPLPPAANVDPIIKKYRGAIRVRIRDQLAIRCRIGSEAMDSKAIAENILAVITTIERRIKLDQFLSSIVVKTTMGKPAKLR
ncbi:MAG: 50S ribosomal protein L1 [Candidatus Methanomethyliaceae archaeon]|nr:50S ribosomal protein L1 [Candidatus Methanomethyliaceae archaeon]